MNSSEQAKVKLINDYMSLMNLDPNNIDYKKIEFELGQALQEKPAINLKYEEETVLNEDGKGEKKISKLTSIEVFYTYTDATGLKYGKLNYIIA